MKIIFVFVLKLLTFCISYSYNQHGGEDDNEQSVCPRELSARFHRSICLTDASVVIISVDLGESHVQRCIVNHAVSGQFFLCILYIVLY